jgi:hypothetical protein
MVYPAPRSATRLGLTRAKGNSNMRDFWVEAPTAAKWRGASLREPLTRDAQTCKGRSRSHPLHLGVLAVTPPASARTLPGLRALFFPKPHRDIAAIKETHRRLEWQRTEALGRGPVRAATGAGPGANNRQQRRFDHMSGAAPIREGRGEHIKVAAVGSVQGSRLSRNAAVAAIALRAAHFSSSSRTAGPLDPRRDTRNERRAIAVPHRVRPSRTLFSMQKDRSRPYGQSRWNYRRTDLPGMPRRRVGDARLVARTLPLVAPRIARFLRPYRQGRP